MSCGEIRKNFSTYLDGAVTGVEMQAIAGHLQVCGGCRREYELLRDSQRLVASLGRRKAPEDLTLRLRVAISREVARSRRPRWEGTLVRLENALNAFMFPAAAGVVSTVLLFALLIGFSAPQPLRAADPNDVPLSLYTPAQLAFAPVDAGLQPGGGGVIVVETYVDSNGRVQDYRILSAPENNDDERLVQQLNHQLIFTMFRPATFFGRPTASRVVLSFSLVNVEG